MRTDVEGRVMCDCTGCPRRAVWQTSSAKEPGYRWAECDVHAAESRKRGYSVRTLRKDRSTPGGGDS